MSAKTPLSPVSPSLLHYARALRRVMTAPERTLWAALRQAALGMKARRQVPLGPFIADFYIATAKLVIEVDGMTHDDPATDAARDKWFFARGVVVVRVTNADVMRDLEGVMSRIAEVVSDRVAPPPQPSPASCKGTPSA